MLETHFSFLSGGKRHAFCRIRKNGCSALQRFIIETSPHRKSDGARGLAFLQRFHSVRSRRALETADSRILVYRDPVDRTRSLYVNKFVQKKDNIDIFGSYRDVTGREPETASLEEFVFSYVSRLEIEKLDPHVWPQNWHLANVVYDRVFPLSQLHDGMRPLIGETLADRFFQRRTNPSPETELRVDPMVERQIKRLYRDDYEMIDRIAGGA